MCFMFHARIRPVNSTEGKTLNRASVLAGYWQFRVGQEGIMFMGCPQLTPISLIGIYPLHTTNYLHKDRPLSILGLWVICAFNINLLMLRLLSPKALRWKDIWKPSKPCYVGIRWIALTGYSQISTHVLGFQSFFRFLHHFVLAK